MSTFKTNTIAFWENFQQKEAEIIRLFENNQPEKTVEMVHWKDHKKEMSTIKGSSLLFFQ